MAELKFSMGSNPARGMLEVYDGKNLSIMIPAGNKA